MGRTEAKTHAPWMDERPHRANDRPGASRVAENDAGGSASIMMLNGAHDFNNQVRERFSTTLTRIQSLRMIS